MKIAVVGCGALGSFYGARLARAGSEVHFLLRSDYAAVRRDGLTIQSIDGDFHLRPSCARRPEEIDRVDLVLIGLKTTANDAFGDLLPPLCDEHTALLTLQNGLGNEGALARFFAPDQILGGLCFVCLNRVRPGVIRHLAHGRILLGEYRGPARERTRAVAARFTAAGIACEVTDNLEQAHWEKLVWNVPFNGLGVASAAGLPAVLSGDPERILVGPCLTTDNLLGDPAWESLVRELMQEILAAARAQGLNISEGLPERMIANTREMGAYKPSTLLDYERGLPLEVESLFGAPLRAAEAAGVKTPRLRALYHLLRHLDAANRNA